jgi:hypothetical protein
VPPARIIIIAGHRAALLPCRPSGAGPASSRHGVMLRLVEFMSSQVLDFFRGRQVTTSAPSWRVRCQCRARGPGHWTSVVQPGQGFRPFGGYRPSSSASYGCAAFVCSDESIGMHHQRLSTAISCSMDQPSRTRGIRAGRGGCSVGGWTSPAMDAAAAFVCSTESVGVHREQLWTIPGGSWWCRAARTRHDHRGTGQRFSLLSRVDRPSGAGPASASHGVSLRLAKCQVRGLRICVGRGAWRCGSTVVRASQVNREDQLILLSQQRHTCDYTSASATYNQYDCTSTQCQCFSLGIPMGGIKRGRGHNGESFRRIPLSAVVERSTWDRGGGVWKP